MFFRELSLGPVALRLAFGDNWSQFDTCFRTRPNGGQAMRETAVRVGFKSDHLVDILGQPNPNDTYITPSGETVYGRITMTPGGGVHVLSAQQVFAKQLLDNKLKAAANQAIAEVKAEPALASA